MREYVCIFLRGFLIVFLISLNTILLSQGRWSAVVVGFCIALVWWVNARTASKKEGIAAMLTYAAGSSLGTCMGLWLSGL